MMINTALRIISIIILLVILSEQALNVCYLISRRYLLIPALLVAIVIIFFAELRAE